MFGRVRSPWSSAGAARGARSARPCLSADDTEAGFAAVDALVALTILATTIVLTLNAVDTARRAAAKALEIRRADVLLRDLIERTPESIGTKSGSVSPFAWRTEVEVAEAHIGQTGAKSCTRTAELRTAGGNHRYALKTLDICQPADVR